MEGICINIASPFPLSSVLEMYGLAREMGDVAFCLSEETMNNTGKGEAIGEGMLSAVPASQLEQRRLGPLTIPRYNTCNRNKFYWWICLVWGTLIEGGMIFGTCSILFFIILV